MESIVASILIIVSLIILIYLIIRGIEYHRKRKFFNKISVITGIEETYLDLKYEMFKRKPYKERIKYWRQNKYNSTKKKPRPRKK
jgi:FtsZ-interacting cell division protein ZipA